MKWTDYRLSKLREMWGKGYPAIEIASMLGVTKNSIIGKANRLNLTARKRSGSLGIKRPRTVSKSEHQESIFMTSEPEKPTTLLGLKDDQCKFPLGKDSPAAFFCGRKRWGMFSYCKMHIEISHVKNPRPI